MSKSGLKSSNEMAFISIDDAAITALCNYIKINNLSEVKSNDKSFNNFDLFLELIEKQNEIRKFEMRDIKKFHNLRKNLFQQSDVISMETVNEYVVLVKVLLAYLYNYRASKLGWEQMVKDYQNNL
ncbi:MAG: hypothetical protein IH915_05925 [Thaumarchaeota archaeon]|nr:hypothetical protein [Nitrososphaerota archaeon]